MTNSFEQMLYLFGAASRGTEPKLADKLNIEEIRKYAQEQGIWTVIYTPLLAVCPEAVKYQSEFLQTISRCMTQKEFTLRVIQTLEKNGISCCMLKGAVVAELYAETDCRVSSDTDILIDPKDEKKLIAILKKLGYRVEERAENDHHVKAYHPVGGLLEAHVQLYSHTTQRILFNGLDMYKEPFSTVQISGIPIKTLGVNDNLMYLTAHYIKHLTNSGGGVRQMMDLLLYLEAYKDEIDFERYENLLKQLRYEKLIQVVKTIGAKYWGFDYPVVEEEMAEKILTDSEDGGIFGFSAENRGNFYDVYCSKRTDMSKYRYHLFKWTKSERTLLERIFLPKHILISCGYSYAKHKLLIPVAWVHHIIDVLQRRKSEKKVKNEPFEARMQMMRDLGMID